MICCTGLDAIGIRDPLAWAISLYLFASAVEELADLREAVAGLDDVRLFCSSCGYDLVLQIGVAGVNLLDCIPDTVGDDLRWDGGFDVQLLACKIDSLDPGSELRKAVDGSRSRGCTSASTVQDQPCCFSLWLPTGLFWMR